MFKYITVLLITNAKRFTCIIILLSIIQGQDTLITRTGTEYIGKLISLNETYVTFYYQDENRTVPIRTVEKIFLESGANINQKITKEKNYVRAN